MKFLLAALFGALCLTIGVSIYEYRTNVELEKTITQLEEKVKLFDQQNKDLTLSNMDLVKRIKEQNEAVDAIKDKSSSMFTQAEAINQTLKVMADRKVALAAQNAAAFKTLEDCATLLTEFVHSISDLHQTVLDPKGNPLKTDKLQMPSSMTDSVRKAENPPENANTVK